MRMALKNVYHARFSSLRPSSLSNKEWYAQECRQTPFIHCAVKEKEMLLVRSVCLHEMERENTDDGRKVFYSINQQCFYFFRLTKKNISFSQKKKKRKMSGVEKEHDSGNNWWRYSFCIWQRSHFVLKELLIWRCCVIVNGFIFSHQELIRCQRKINRAMKICQHMSLQLFLWRTPSEMCQKFRSFHWRNGWVNRSCRNRSKPLKADAWHENEHSIFAGDHHIIVVAGKSENFSI